MMEMYTEVLNIVSRSYPSKSRVYALHLSDYKVCKSKIYIVFLGFCFFLCQAFKIEEELKANCTALPSFINMFRFNWFRPTVLCKAISPNRLPGAELLSTQSLLLWVQP